MIAGKKQLDKSRLGRLLVNRGYITERQLSKALVDQKSAGMLLGEYLIAQGTLTEKDLERTLRHQTRYRYAAAFVAMVVAPLQPAIAFAASSPAKGDTNFTAAEQMAGFNSGHRMKALTDETMSGISGQGVVSNFNATHHLKALTDEAMSDISAQGITQDVAAIMGNVKNGRNPDAIKVIKTLSNIMLPVTNFLTYNSTVQGVTYDKSKPVFQILAQGKMQLAFPTHIDKISLENIRVRGSASTAPSFGSVYINDINFSPDSKMIITVH